MVCHPVPVEKNIKNEKILSAINVILHLIIHNVTEKESCAITPRRGGEDECEFMCECDWVVFVEEAGGETTI